MGTTNTAEAAFTGERIRQCREAVGMKVNQLAEAVGASRNTITNYEAGRTEPNASDLIRIARALGCTLNDLLGVDGGPEDAPRFAFHGRGTTRDLGELRALALRGLRDYRDVEELTGARLDVRFATRAFDPNEVPWQGWIRAAADVCRHACGLSDSSPERLPLLLERLGIRTRLVDSEMPAFDGISVVQGGFQLLLLNRREKALERVITTAARELGHLVFHPELFTAAGEPGPDTDRDYEAEANLFAGHFLVPTDDLLAAWKSEHLARLPIEHALLLLKRIFHVSYWLLHHRLEQEGLTAVEHNELVTRTKKLLGTAGRTRMENLEPEPMPVHCLPRFTRFERLVRNAFVAERIGIGKVAELLGVTIDEANELTAEWWHPQHAHLGEQTVVVA